MSREFDGIDDRLVVDAGAVTSDGGPMTLLFLWRPLSSHAGGIIRAFDSGGGIWNVNPFSDGNVYFGVDGQGFTSMTYSTAQNWVLGGFSKANGSATARGHRYVYDTATWTHTNLGVVGDDTITGTMQEIVLGEFTSGQSLHGRLAVVGVWQTVLSDGQIEGLISSLADWSDLSPTALWAFNQASTSDPVLDLTGGGADQTAITGTTVSADEPAGFTYEDVVTGTLAATLPALTTDLDGRALADGTLAATLPALTVSLTGTAQASGTVAALLPGLVADLNGAARADGLVGVTLPPLVAHFTDQPVSTHIPELGGDVAVRGLAGTVAVI
jgi:hypothetical protein